MGWRCVRPRRRLYTRHFRQRLVLSSFREGLTDEGGGEALAGNDVRHFDELERGALGVPVEDVLALGCRAHRAADGPARGEELGDHVRSEEARCTWSSLN